MNRHQGPSVSLWQHRYSGICQLCRSFIIGSFRKHWPLCSEAQRLATWQKITSESLDPNPHQSLYITAGDHMRYLLHTLNSLIANGDEPLLEAGLVFINAWREQERNSGNNKYSSILLNIPTEHTVFLRAIAHQINSIFNHHGTTLPVILAIEDAFWALSRKLDFTIEENTWLLQWVGFAPWENNHLIWHIKQRFLMNFLPVGRPRKSFRILKRKLRELWEDCKGYEYSSAPWTWELDGNLLRISRRFGSLEERVFGFVGFCYAFGLRLRSLGDVLRRMKVLGCESMMVKVEEGEYGNGDVWETVRGKTRSLEVFRSGRRASV